MKSCVILDREYEGNTTTHCSSCILKSTEDRSEHMSSPVRQTLTETRHTNAISTLKLTRTAFCMHIKQVA